MPRILGRMIVAVLAVPTLVGCQILVVSYDKASPVTQRTGILTPDGTDQYRFTITPGAVDVESPATNTGADLRMLFWPDKAPVVADSQSCATWTDANSQEGAALRIRRSNSGRLRAITVTKNVMFYSVWVFNFHTWDSASSQPFVRFAQVSVPALREGGGVVAAPWYFCARIIGSVVEFKVWTDATAEPAWGDATWGGQAIVPSGWSTGGTTGWYIGHIGPGRVDRFADLRTWRYDGTPDPISTTAPA